MAWKKSVTFDYEQYFKTITPRTELQIYNRFLFAFCSVHTTWQSNLAGYNIFKNKYHTDINNIKENIKKSGMGLFSVRSRAISEFTKKYLNNPSWYLKKETETWNDYATRLEQDIFGLGFAKTRFAIELIYPNEAILVCTDTHIIQWAGFSPNKMTYKKYRLIEDKFLKHSVFIGKKPIENRWRTWDKKQGFTDPRYWSYCLEDS